MLIFDCIGLVADPAELH